MPVATEKPVSAHPIGYTQDRRPILIDPIWYRALDRFLGGDASSLNGQTGSYYLSLANATNLLTAGKVQWNVRVLSADAMAAAGDWCDVSAAGGSRVITLPPAADNAGLTILVRKTDSSANTVTVDGNGSETINGSTTQAITAKYTTLTLSSNGTEWAII